MYADVRGQLSGIGSFPPSTVGSRDGTQAIALCSKYSHLLSHLISPNQFFLKQHFDVIVMSTSPSFPNSLAIGFEIGSEYVALGSLDFTVALSLA